MELDQHFLKGKNGHARHFAEFFFKYPNITHDWKYLIHCVSSMANCGDFSSGPKTSFFGQNQPFFHRKTGNFFTGRPVNIF